MLRQISSEKFFPLFLSWTCDFPLSIFYVLTFAGNFLRYAYSEELGEEFDEEEAQSLTREKPDGDISLVEKKEKSVGGTRVFDEDGEAEEDKREWSTERFLFSNLIEQSKIILSIRAQRWLSICFLCACEWHPFHLVSGYRNVARVLVPLHKISILFSPLLMHHAWLGLGCKRLSEIL